jgi:hypothetical protein
MKIGLDCGHLVEARLRVRGRMERDPNPGRLDEQMNSRDDRVSRHRAASSEFRCRRSSEVGVISFSQHIDFQQL